jgi:hypothetical protein
MEEHFLWKGYVRCQNRKVGCSFFESLIDQLRRKSFKVSAKKPAIDLVSAFAHVSQTRKVHLDSQRVHLDSQKVDDLNS